MSAADVLTDDLIRRVIGRVDLRAMQLNAYPHPKAGTIYRLVEEALKEERTPISRFLVEVRAESRARAGSFLYNLIGPHEDVRVVPLDDERMFPFQKQNCDDIVTHRGAIQEELKRAQTPVHRFVVEVRAETRQEAQHILIDSSGPLCVLEGVKLRSEDGASWPVSDERDAMRGG